MQCSLQVIYRTALYTRADQQQNLVTSGDVFEINLLIHDLASTKAYDEFIIFLKFWY